MHPNNLHLGKFYINKPQSSFQVTLGERKNPMEIESNFHQRIAEFLAGNSMRAKNCLKNTDGLALYFI
ncbi:hypothetical protein BH10BAC2_BH10BAC2_32950 [soil metagenome]